MMKKLLALGLVFVVLFSACIGEEREPSPGVTTTTVQTEDPRFIEAREHMVRFDLRRRDITDEKVLGVMARVQRHNFVSKDLQDNAYADHPLPIGYGQTISQPYIVALMTQGLDLREGDRVLEIGTGSGYQAAVLAEIVDEVYTIEIIEELAGRANKTLKDSGYENVEVKAADGYFGWEEHAPFDAIIVTCAANHIPPPLIEQLDDGGRLIIPLGSTKYHQTLTLVEKRNDTLETKYITSVRFVPMTGEALKGG